MVYDTAVIGAGASGLMAASRRRDEKICIIDSNKTIGQKIKISGGGKCNITNKYMDESHFLGDKEFIWKTLKRFNEKDLLKFVNKNGVFPKIDEKIVKGTYFCNASSDVINMFKKLTSHCHYKLAAKVLDVDFRDGNFITRTDKGEISSKKLIVASGGLSYSSIGASDIGFKIAQKFGHAVKRTDPALVGLRCRKSSSGSRS